MAISTQTQNLNLIPGKSAPVVVHLSQGDTGRTVKLNIFNGNVAFDLSECSAAVHGVRPDNGHFGPISCSCSGNVVTFTTTSAMTAIAGGVLAEITISKSGSFVGSANFALLVENATWSNGVSYSNDVSVYESILAYVQKELGFLTARVDNIASIPSGSTSGDAELIDIRLKADGTTALTAGNAVREQITNVNNVVDSLEVTPLKALVKKNGYPSSDGTHWVGVSTGEAKHIVIPVKKGDIIRVKSKSTKITGLRGLVTYNTSSPPDVSVTPPFNGHIAIAKNTEKNYTVPENVNFIVICAYYVNKDYDLPSYFYVNGYNLSVSPRTNITTAINDLETERIVRQQADSVLNDSIMGASSRLDQNINAVESSLATEIDTRSTADAAFSEALNNKIPLPSNGFGTSGMFLRSTGSGTEWAESASPTYEQIEEVIDSWLDEHPEATTSVPDHSITFEKLVNGTIKYAIPEMYGAVGDGETDDSSAVQQCVNENKFIYFGGTGYRFKNIQITHDVYILFRTTITPIYCDDSRNVYYSLFEISGANAVFEGIDIEGSYTTQTTKNPPYSKPLFRVTDGSIRISNSKIAHFRLVNRGSTPTDYYDRTGAIVMAINSDVYVINCDISDFEKEELIWALPSSLDSVPKRKVVVSGCIFHDGYGYSLTNAIARDFIFSNNIVTNWQYTGSAVNGFGINSYFYNNRIHDNGFTNIFDNLERTDEGFSFANRICIYNNVMENNGDQSNIIHAAARIVDIQNNIANGKTFFRTWGVTQPFSSYFEEGDSTIIIRGNYFKQTGTNPSIGNRIIECRYKTNDHVRYLFVLDNELIGDDTVQANACIAIPNIAKAYIRNNLMYAASLSTSNTNTCCWIHIPNTNTRNVEIVSFSNYMKHTIDCKSYLHVLNSSAITISIMTKGDVFDVASDSGYIAGNNIERIPAYSND